MFVLLGDARRRALNCDGHLCGDLLVVFLFLFLFFSFSLWIIQAGDHLGLMMKGYPAFFLLAMILRPSDSLL